MRKEIYLKGKRVEYELTYKKVKNLNLRIKPDGRVCVSVSRWVSQKSIEEFLQANKLQAVGDVYVLPIENHLLHNDPSKYINKVFLQVEKMQ